MKFTEKIKALWNLPEKLSRIETEILVLSQTVQRIEYKLHEFYGQVLPQVEDIRRVSQMYLEKTTKETVGEFVLVKAKKELLKGKANGKAKTTRTK